MTNDQLIGLLEDPRVLLEAHAASSAYVMRKAFAESKELQVFGGRVDLAPAILDRIQRLSDAGSDPVVVSAHLYALELTGAATEVGAAVVQVLGDEALRADPMLGQFAGQTGASLIHTDDRVAAGSYFEPEELKGILRALQREEEDR